jgi:hypothetical protein
MPSNEGDGLARRAVRQRDRSRRTGPQGRRYAGHNFEWNVVFGEKLGFLAAAAEDAWVASFQANDSESFARPVHQHIVDGFLQRRADAIAALPGINALCIWTNLGQQVGMDQGVVDDDVGGSEQAEPANGNQIGRSRPGADEEDSTNRVVNHGTNDLSTAADAVALDGFRQQSTWAAGEKQVLRRSTGGAGLGGWDTWKTTCIRGEVFLAKMSNYYCPLADAQEPGIEKTRSAQRQAGGMRCENS